MKETKFRAWDKNEKKMVYDIQREYDGSVYKRSAFGEYLGQDCGHGRDGTWRLLEEDYLIEHKAPERFIVMQFTGLRDRKGKEIYGGDIVKESSLYYSPEMSGDCIKCPDEIFEVKSIQDIHQRIGERLTITRPEEKKKFQDGGFYEIIGNIYENKKLLEAK